MSDIRTRQIQANGLTFTIDEAGEGDDVALFLHGFPESRRSWRRQLPFIAGQGWRAVAPDLRGYGQSSRPSGRAAYRLDNLIADVGALFDALGARRRILIGHDWGGIIAWTAAIQRVRPLDGLVIMNAPHPAAYARYVHRSPAQMLRSWYVLYFQLPWLPELATTAGHAHAIERAFVGTTANPGVFSAEDLQVYRDNALAPGAMTAMINYYRANALALNAADRTLTRKVETPTLLIWGEKDPFLGVALTELNVPYVDDLTIRRLPGISHWVQQEAPDQVNATLAGWMADKQLTP
jgi:pimeloyl-ACP methyl ester carboxylesterase